MISSSLLLHDIALADGVEEGERGAVAAVVGVGGVHGLEQIAHMADMDARLADSVGLLDNLSSYSVKLCQYQDRRWPNFGCTHIESTHVMCSKIMKVWGF